MGHKILTNKQLKEIEQKIDTIIARSSNDHAVSNYYNNSVDDVLLDSYIQMISKSKKQAQIKKIGLSVIG
ncbi:MAG: hypothetical protein H6626_15285 [Pseudobdellovibrionaceae bacterium]|nr:MAG: hypothetical protein H6626_15285 [Pseudobdellovibrionaceae bacterium]